MAALPARRRARFVAGVSAAVLFLAANDIFSTSQRNFAVSSGGGLLGRPPFASAGRGFVSRPSVAPVRLCRISLKAGEEDALFAAINSNPDAKDRIIKACESFGTPPKDALGMLTGDWTCKWDSSTAGKDKQKRLLKVCCSALPPVMVEFISSYARFMDNTYSWIEGFTVPGSERVDAALVLSGPYKKGKKAGEFQVEITHVHLCTADSNSAESREVLVSAGLSKFLKPFKLQSEGAMTITINHVSGVRSVQQDEIGNYYALSRSKIPYVLG